MRTALIHIGYHKTGTTWLQKHVFADAKNGFTPVHPRTLIDEAFVIVGPFSFDRTAAAEHLRPIFEKAESTDTVPVISHERLSGHPLRGAYDAQLIADRLVDTYPQASILVVIREQKAMMLSTYKHHILRTGTRPLRRIWEERTLAQRRSAGPTLEVFEYHRLIGYYQKLFGSNRVLVMPFESLMSDPLRFVGQIADLVGLPKPTSVTEERENVALPALALAGVRRLNAFLTMIGLQRVVVGPPADSEIRRGKLEFVRAVGRYAPKSLSAPIERKWRAQIAELAAGRFGESNKITADLTGLDLGSLGYDMS